MRYLLLAIAVITWIIVSAMKKGRATGSPGGDDEARRTSFLRRRRAKRRAEQLAEAVHSSAKPKEVHRMVSKPRPKVHKLPPSRGPERRPRISEQRQPPPRPALAVDAPIAVIVNELRSGGEASRSRALGLLVARGEEALPELQRAALDVDPIVRRQAHEAMRQILAASPLERVSEWTPPRPHEPEQPPPPRPPLPEKPESEPAPETPQAADAEPEDSTEALAGGLRAVAAAPGFGGERDELLAELGLSEAGFALLVDAVQWSGVIGVSDAWREGRRVSGTLVGTDVPVAVHLKADVNEQADALSRGDRVEVRARLVDWDAIYDRAVFEGALTS